MNVPIPQAMVALGDLVTITSGFAFKSERFAGMGELPVARIRDVKRGYSETFYSGDYDDQFLIDDGDLLVGMDGEFNRERWQGGKALLNQRVCKLVANERKLSKDYLYHFLPRALKEIEDRTPFATVKHLSSKDIRAIQIPLPTLDAQRRIAAILDKADVLRRKRKRTLEMLDSLAVSIFLDTFGDPVSNPKGWIERPLGYYETFLTSGSRGWARYYSAAGKAFIRIQNLQRGELSVQDIVYVDPPDSAEARRTTVRAGDVLISITADLGRTAVVPMSLDGQAHINQHIALVRTKGIDPTYLSMYLASEAGRLQFDALNRQGVKAGLNFDNIRSLRILEPPMGLQEKYVKTRSAIRRIADKLDRELMTLHALFSSLQHRAFSGQL